MRGLILVALGALSLAACAPQPRQLVSQAVPERPASLLKKLDLDIPADLVNLPAISPFAEAQGRVTGGAPAFAALGQSAEDAQRAQDCLTAAVYYEARSEPIDGQRAVAQVVLNRVRDRAFPGSVCGVVYQGHERRTGCQFSFTCDGSMLRPRDPGAWARSGMIAAAALAGQVYAPVGSATHFHTAAINPWWAPSLTKLTQVGFHVFYRWPSAMERALAFRQNYDGVEPDAPIPGMSIAGTTNGVTIHSGNAAPVSAATQTVAGVTIHRGLQQVAAQVEAASPTAVPAAQPVAAVAAAAPVAAPIRLGTETSGGVRVHRGISAPGES
jgi:hypothetical protein